MSDLPTKLNPLVEKLNIGGYKRHLLLCVGPKCCSAEEGQLLWEYVKKRFKELDLTNKAAFRTKAGCLRICCNGPIALVYPEGVWYAGLDAEKIDRIIEDHVIGGRPVDEYAFAKNPF